MRVEKVKPDPLNLSVKTDAGSIQTSIVFEAFLMREGFLYSIASEFNVYSFAGGLEADIVCMRVEKVEPDPLNLLVKTDVGKQIIRKVIQVLS